MLSGHINPLAPEFRKNSFNPLAPEFRKNSFNPLAPEFRKNSFNPAGKLQLFRSVKLIETHGIMKITKKIYII